jgi:hypothetical protein
VQRPDFLGRTTVAFLFCWYDSMPRYARRLRGAAQLPTRSFELLMSKRVQSANEVLAALPFPPDDLEEIADLEPGTLSGRVQSRIDPVLKPEFRDEKSNIVSLFDRKKG